MFGKKKEKRIVDNLEKKYDEFLDEACSGGCSLCNKCQSKVRDIITKRNDEMPVVENQNEITGCRYCKNQAVFCHVKTGKRIEVEFRCLKHQNGK